MWIAIATVLGLLAVLAIPVQLAFRVERVAASSGQVTIRWLFGFVRFRIGIPLQRAPTRPEAAAARTRPTRERRAARFNAFAALRLPEFRRRVYRFAGDLLRATHMHQLFLRMRLGLGDPADTGRLWAVVGPLSALAQNLHSAEVRVEPEFMDTACEFVAQGRLRLIPLQFMALVIGFALSPATWQAWRRARGAHA